MDISMNVRPPATAVGSRRAAPLSDGLEDVSVSRRGEHVRPYPARLRYIDVSPLPSNANAINTAFGLSPSFGIARAFSSLMRDILELDKDRRHPVPGPWAAGRPVMGRLGV